VESLFLEDVLQLMGYSLLSKTKYSSKPLLLMGYSLVSMTKSISEPLFLISSHNPLFRTLHLFLTGSHVPCGVPVPGGRAAAHGLQPGSKDEVND
jgi:hypothetical protein